MLGTGLQLKLLNTVIIMISHQNIALAIHRMAPLIRTMHAK